jgi:hypothetical protein
MNENGGIGAGLLAPGTGDTDPIDTSEAPDDLVALAQLDQQRQMQAPQPMFVHHFDGCFSYEAAIIRLSLIWRLRPTCSHSRQLHLVTTPRPKRSSTPSALSVRSGPHSGHCPCTVAEGLLSGLI